MKKTLFLFAFLSFIIISCNKDSIIQNTELKIDTFFEDNYISKTNPNVVPYSVLSGRSDKKEKFKKQVKNFYKFNPEKKEILKNNLGHVIWDRLSLTEFEEYSLGVLPIAKQNSYFTEGILMVTLNESKEVLNIAVDKRNKFDHLPIITEDRDNNNEVDLILIVSQFLTFDKTVFEYSDCDLVSKLEPYNLSGRVSNEAQPRECELVMNTTETHWVVCVGSVNDPNEYCYVANTTYETTYEEYCSTGGGIPEGGSGPSGGGPSGPGSGDDPNLETIINILVDPYQNDNIYPSLNLLQNDKFMCIYQSLLNGPLSMFCQTIGNFEDLTDYSLNIKSCSEDPFAGCQTYTSNPYNDINGWNIDIFIDSNADPIKMAETIIHEGIHASLQLHLSGYNISGNLNTVEYLKLYKYYNGFTNYSDHVFIGDYYIKPIAQLLRQLDNNSYPESHYYGIVYEGIEYFINQAGIDRLIDQYSSYKQYNSMILSNSSLCD